LSSDQAWIFREKIGMEPVQLLRIRYEIHFSVVVEIPL